MSWRLTVRCCRGSQGVSHRFILKIFFFLFLPVCMGIEVRNYITEIRKYENCTVVEGHVAIFLIDLDTAAAYETVSLPRLREITDYLLLYHAQNMKTLSNIFPNLSVIRGRKLFYHYAIVVFEMRSLDNLGLRSLTLIERGAIYAENNPQLCYLDTIDWGRIMTLKEENRFSRNNNPEECFNMYPEISYGNPMANTAVGTGPRCWNYNILQKSMHFSTNQKINVLGLCQRFPNFSGSRPT